MVCRLFSPLKETYTLYTHCKINHTRQSGTLTHISQTNVSGCNSVDGEHMKQNETSLQVQVTPHWAFKQPSTISNSPFTLVSEDQTCL